MSLRAGSIASRWIVIALALGGLAVHHGAAPGRASRCPGVVADLDRAFAAGAMDLLGPHLRDGAADGRTTLGDGASGRAGRNGWLSARASLAAPHQLWRSRWMRRWQPGPAEVEPLARADAPWHGYAVPGSQGHALVAHRAGIDHVPRVALRTSPNVALSVR